MMGGSTPSVPMGRTLPGIFAARRWAGTTGETDSHLLFGAACREELLVELVEGYFSKVHFATLDGSFGFHGDVVAMCADLLNGGVLPATILYSCGPRGMIRALDGEVGGRFREHYTSLEAVMACGVGACRGCTVPVRSREGIAYKAVCSDGTVFRAKDISWEVWEE